jgi:hypothetical protein
VNISIPTQGVLHTETFGWAYGSQSTRWVLVPGTLIALATILIVALALYRHAGDISREAGQFDPSDPLRLIAAAATGGLNSAFRGLSEKDVKEGEQLDVVLGVNSWTRPCAGACESVRPCAFACIVSV